jgi:hypothetical protein
VGSETTVCSYDSASIPSVHQGFKDFDFFFDKMESLRPEIDLNGILRHIYKIRF